MIPLFRKTLVARAAEFVCRHWRQSNERLAQALHQIEVLNGRAKS